MFSTLESSWDHSARRGWSAAASFTFQAMALSLLVAIPLFWVQGPPRLQWLQTLSVPPMRAPAPPVEVVREHYSAGSVSNLLNNHLLQPQRIPLHAAPIDDSKSGPPAPDLPNVHFGRGGPGDVAYSLGDNLPAVAPKPPAPTHPLRISHWAEGNLIYRVQPLYPPLARQARIQGAVQLRAIISKSGTIERLTLESGHPMLAGAAIDAVRQWRYRPYLLNDEPVEIETEITVNFVLSGS
jgi:protein TonB